MSFGELICVYIFRNISATFPSGVKYGFRPLLGALRLLTRPKLSAISRSGRCFFIRPSSVCSNERR